MLIQISTNIIRSYIILNLSSTSPISIIASIHRLIIYFHLHFFISWSSLFTIISHPIVFCSVTLMYIQFFFCFLFYTSIFHLGLGFVPNIFLQLLQGIEQTKNRECVYKGIACQKVNLS